MNTVQIAYALEQDPKTNKMFCGVFPSDKFPHTVECFDSYGKPPEFYGPAFTEFLNKHCDQWELSDRKLQSDWSDVCGHYCIFYLSHRARGQSMKKIVQLFGNDTVLNDSKVLWFVKTHFRVALKQPSVGFVQCCKKLIQ